MLTDAKDREYYVPEHDGAGVGVGDGDGEGVGVSVGVGVGVGVCDGVGVGVGKAWELKSENRNRSGEFVPSFLKIPLVAELVRAFDTSAGEADGFDSR